VIAMRAHFQMGEVDKALHDVYERSKRLRPAFRALQPHMKKDQRDHARAKEGPDGSWAPRAAATEARRRSSNRKLRVTKAMRAVMLRPLTRRRPTPAKVLGRLPQATKYSVGALYVRASSRSVYPGGANQHGGQVGHKRRVKLPARPFLWISAALLEESRKLLAKFVVAGWPGAKRP